MQNRDANLLDPFYLTVGSTVQYDNYVANLDYDFSFSGFGPNDPRKRKAFTPGSYTITEGRRYLIGDYRWRSRDYYYGNWYPIVERLRNTGVIDYHGNNLARVSLSCTPQTGLSTVVYNNALTQLYDRLRSSELNLALTIGERKESAKMLRKAWTAAASVVRMARKVRREILHNPTLLASNLWLQYKYGWLPLYNDVYQAVNWHFHLFDEMRFVGKYKRKVEWDSVSQSAWLGSVNLKRTHEQKCLIIVEAGIANSDAYNLSRITSLNPLSIAWELVPFSFVADWFVDVGGYLANMEASLGTGLSFKRGMVTEVAHMTTFAPGEIRSWKGRQTYWSDYFVDHFYDYIIDDKKNWRREVTKTRSVLGGFPRARFPVFQVSLGSQRIISAAALIRQVLLGGIRH